MKHCYSCFSIYIAVVHACTIYIADLFDPMFYVHELKIKLLKSKFESCPVSSCSRSWYLGIVTSSFPASQASCELVFSPCCSYAEVTRVLFSLNSHICAWKGKTYRHICIYSIQKLKLMP